MSETAQENAPGSAPRGPRLGRLRFSAVEMLIAQVLLIVAAPFLEGLRGGELTEAVLMSLFFLSAVLAVGGRHRMLAVTIVLAVPAMVTKWWSHLHHDSYSPVMFHLSAIVFLIFVIVNMLRFVLRTRHVDAEVLCASISAYLTLGLVWALAYRLVALVTPAAFTFNSTQVVSQPMEGFTAYYFSFVTLTTVGYGDITPASPIARMLAVMESMTGTLYVAVLIARLVAVYSKPDPSASPSKSNPTPP